MKKRVAVAIMMILVMTTMLFMGCQTKEPSDSGKNAAEDSEQKSKKPEDMFVGITVMSVGNDFMLHLSEGLKGTIEERGAKVQLDSAEMDVTTQIEQIENFTSMGCDVIVIWAVNGEGVASACQKAMDEGVQIVAFAMEVPGVTSSVISASEQEMAEQAVIMTNDWIEETFPDAGNGEVKVLVVTASSSPEVVIRSESMQKIADNKKVTMVTQETEDYNSSDIARTLAENTFQKEADIDAVLAVNGATALGFESFLVSSSSPVTDKEHFGIFGIDESEEVVSKIKASVTNESLIRGTISMGGMDVTIADLMKAIDPLLAGEKAIDVKGAAEILTAETLGE